MSAVTVYIANEFLQTVLGMEHHLFCFSLFVGTKVCQRYLDTGIKECQLTHAACNNIPFVYCSGEDGWVWPELLACTALVGLANHLYRIERLSLFVFLLVDLASTEHLRHHVC